MEGMLAQPKIGRRRRGAPLKAFTMAARASGNPGLDADQAAVVAAWLKLDPRVQRAVIEDVLSRGQQEVTMEDVLAEGGEAPQEDVESPGQDEEPVVNADGGGKVVEGGLWEPPPPLETGDGDD